MVVPAKVKLCMRTCAHARTQPVGPGSTCMALPSVTLLGNLKAQCSWEIAGSRARGVLDFGGTSDVILVAEGGLLALRGIVVRGLAQPSTRGAIADGLVLRPSLQLVPGARVSCRCLPPCGPTRSSS